MTGYRVTITTAAHEGDQVAGIEGTLEEGDLVMEQGGMGVQDLPAKLRELAALIEQGADVRMINIERPQSPDPLMPEQQAMDL